jgi:hypothetical protein
MKVCVIYLNKTAQNFKKTSKKVAPIYKNIGVFFILYHIFYKKSTEKLKKFLVFSQKLGGTEPDAWPIEGGTFKNRGIHFKKRIQNPGTKGKMKRKTEIKNVRRKSGQSVAGRTR